LLCFAFERLFETPGEVSSVVKQCGALCTALALDTNSCWCELRVVRPRVICIDTVGKKQFDQRVVSSLGSVV
jgi:hypothetical protein